MKNAHSIVLKILGILLLTAAILKGWQLLTEPLANKDIWSYRPLLIFTVEFELALALWLLSGLFKKAAWLASLAVFSLFSLITLYKGLSGADSCGCFGAVKVNPWITLFAIDLPAVIALLIFRPQRSTGFQPMSFRSPICREEESAEQRRLIFNQQPASSTQQLSYNFTLPHVAYLAIVFLVITISTVALALNKPATVTSSYEVLEPETWIGKRLPILEYIDIGKQLEKGNWLVLFYHYDCPECQKQLPKIWQLALELRGNEDVLKIAICEIPPYNQESTLRDSYLRVAKLMDKKKWFAETPSMILLRNNHVDLIWNKLESVALLQNSDFFKRTILGAVLNKFGLRK